MREIVNCNTKEIVPIDSFIFNPSKLYILKIGKTSPKYGLLILRDGRYVFKDLYSSSDSYWAGNGNYTNAKTLISMFVDSTSYGSNNVYEFDNFNELCRWYLEQ